MSRFKVSKYRNAISQPFKKENWINDLNVNTNLHSNGDHIKASCSYVAFHNDSNSTGSIAVLPLGSAGRFSSFPQISGHQGFVTDFDFSPFHDNVISTGSEDCTVKLWSIPDDGISGVLSTPASVLDVKFEKRVESVLFHPAADNVLAVSAGTTINIWDIDCNRSISALGGHEDTVLGISWNGIGSQMASICKENKQKKLRVFDPRSGACSQEAGAHSGLKESKVSWLGDSDIIVTSGFNQMRAAEMAVWDIRNISHPINLQSVGGNVGVPMLFYDEDCKMLYVAAKSETTISYFELTEKSPFLSQGPNLYRGTLQQKGMAMVPKRALVVMGCEIARLLQLTQNAIVPISFCIQRKSYRDFHGDLFPDTKGEVPSMTSAQWREGINEPVATISLDPSKRKPAVKKVAVSSKDDKQHTADVTPLASSKTPQQNAPSNKSDDTKSPVSGTAAMPTASSKDAATPSSVAAQKIFSGVHSSKFRHIQGSPMHRSTYIESIPNLNTTISGDCNSFQVNREVMVVPLAGAGGRLAVFERSKPGRLSRDVPTVENSGDVLDFVLDPFNNRRLVVSLDTVRVLVWQIPDSGLMETLREPEFKLQGHREKANILCFHPLASDVMATAGYDGKLLIWDMNKRQVEISLDPVQEPLFSVAWSQDGTKLATVGRDGSIKIYDPRSSTSPIAEGPWSGGSHGARVIWLSNEVILISSFTKSSCRQLSVHHIDNLSQASSVTEVNIAPGILIPYFDEDTNIVFLGAKGDSSVMAYEFLKDNNSLFQLPTFQTSSQQQAVCFVDKIECEVKGVEIARGVRLCKSSAEPFLFKVPRVKLDYFQDDIYPETRVKWEPALKAEEWFAGKNGTQNFISLQPAGMKLLSEAPKLAPPPKKYTYDFKAKTDEEKKEELVSAMIDRMAERDQEPLPQDSQEGVDDEEWDD